MIFKAIILDMDGTLVNTETLWKDAERALLASHERTYDTVIHADFLGLAVNDFIPAIQQAYDLAHVDATQLEQELEDRVRDLLSTQTKAQAGTVELIQYIVDNEIPCAIASNSSHPIIEATLQSQDWADALDKRYSADDVPHAKPAPDLYLHAAQKLNISPAECVAVEDSLNGVKAAVSAGMTCLAVPDFELSDVTKYQAVTSHVYKSLHDVLAFIQKNF